MLCLLQLMLQSHARARRPIPASDYRDSFLSEHRDNTVIRATSAMRQSCDGRRHAPTRLAAHAGLRSISTPHCGRSQPSGRRCAARTASRSRQQPSRCSKRRERYPHPMTSYSRLAEARSSTTALSRSRYEPQGSTPPCMGSGRPSAPGPWRTAKIGQPASSPSPMSSGMP